MSDLKTSNLITPLIEASHTNDIPSSASSAPQGTKNSIVGTLAGKAVQAMLPGAQRGLSAMFKAKKPVDVDTNLANYQLAHPDRSFPDHRKFFDENIGNDPVEPSGKPPKSGYPFSRGEPSTLSEPLLSENEQSDYKTADAENTGETPPAYNPPTLPNSVQ